MKLPWGFYIDALTLVGTGAGLMLAVINNSLEMMAYHIGIGFFFTWHLAELVKKFANSKINTGDDNESK